jgi:hypothetical protein
LALLRHFDLVVLVAALPIFVGADLPLVGYGAVTAAWVGQRLLQYALARRARVAPDARKEAGIVLAGMFARMTLLVAAIVAAGLVERKAGLAAAVLAAAVFTVNFFITLVTGALQPPRSPSS